MNPTQYAAIKGIGDPGKARVMMFANGQPVHAPMNAVTSAAIDGATLKATPVDADEFGYYDSVGKAPVKATWANLKAAMWAAWGSLIASGTAKTTPANGDMFALADSAASNATKQLSWANLKATLIAALGTAATQNTGTSGHAIPFLDGNNTWSGTNAFQITDQGGTLLTMNLDLEEGAGIFQATRYSNPGGPVFFGRRARNTRASPAAVQSGDTIIGFRGYGYTGSAFISGAAGVAFLLEAAENWSPTANGTQIRFFTTLNGTTTLSEVLRIGNNALVTTTGSLSRGAPATKTTSFTLANTENWVICNGAATITATLPAASAFAGREIMIKTIAAFTVVSGSSNVVPLNGGAAGTAILAAAVGKWATLVSDGTNWIIMAAN